MSNFGGDQAVSTSTPIFLGGRQQAAAATADTSFIIIIVVIFLEERGREEFGRNGGPMLLFLSHFQILF